MRRFRFPIARIFRLLLDRNRGLRKAWSARLADAAWRAIDSQKFFKQILPCAPTPGFQAASFKTDCNDSLHLSPLPLSDVEGEREP